MVYDLGQIQEFRDLAYSITPRLLDILDEGKKQNRPELLQMAAKLKKIKSDSITPNDKRYLDALKKDIYLAFECKVPPPVDRTPPRKEKKIFTSDISGIIDASDLVSVGRLASNLYVGAEKGPVAFRKEEKWVAYRPKDAISKEEITILKGNDRLLADFFSGFPDLFDQCSRHISYVSFIPDIKTYKKKLMEYRTIAGFAWRNQIFVNSRLDRKMQIAVCKHEIEHVRSAHMRLPTLSNEHNSYCAQMRFMEGISLLDVNEKEDISANLSNVIRNARELSRARYLDLFSSIYPSSCIDVGMFMAVMDYEQVSKAYNHIRNLPDFDRNNILDRQILAAIFFAGIALDPVKTIHEKLHSLERFADYSGAKYVKSWLMHGVQDIMEKSA